MFKRKALAALAAGALFSLSAGVAHAAGTVSNTAPADGSTLPGTSTTITGNVSASGSIGGGPRHLTYLVDVSGSTGYTTGLDCNGDGTAGNAGDNLNGDGRIGDILDCEIAAVQALNASLTGTAELQVGVNAFGSSSAYADMGSGTTFVAPGATDENGARRVNIVSSSLTQGRIGQYTPNTRLSTGTSFNNALTSVTTAYAGVTGEKWVFMLTDGESSVSTSTLTALQDAGIKVRTFSVGSGAAGCQATGSVSPLYAIAASTGESCIVVDDPTKLTAAFAGAPVNVSGLTVTVTGTEGFSQTLTPTINALGDWSTTELTGLAPGTYTVTSNASFTDGTTATDTSTFVVAGSTESPSPTVTPTETPTVTPSETPTVTPSATPSASPTVTPSVKPSKHHTKPGHTKPPLVVPNKPIKHDPQEGKPPAYKDKHGGLAKTGA